MSKILCADVLCVSNEAPLTKKGLFSLVLSRGLGKGKCGKCKMLARIEHQRRDSITHYDKSRKLEASGAMVSL
jgi:hypothetical protein